MKYLIKYKKLKFYNYNKKKFNSYNKKKFYNYNNKKHWWYKIAKLIKKSYKINALKTKINKLNLNI